MPKYRFEQLAINNTAKRKPTEEDMQTYIGLEHLDTGSITVKRWGSDVPIKGDKLIMKKGNVLLGKRNAYLRRAAIAPHDGLFSAHGMVLNPIEDVVDKDFFPLFVASDYFFDAAIAISVGSLSPTINWSDLAKLKFNIPSEEEQRKIAQVLWSINNTIDSYQKLLEDTNNLVKGRFVELFGELEANTNKYRIRKLSEISSYWNGLTYKPADVIDDGSGVLVLRSGNIQNGELAFDDNVRVSCEIKDKLYVRDNDILMCSRNGSAALVGKTALIKDLEESMSFGAFMMIIRSEYYPFLKTYFDTPYFRNQISTGTSTINQITAKMLNQVEIPVPDMDTVREFDDFLIKCDESKSSIRDALDAVKTMKRGIIADALNG